jgi:DNA replication protein DnaC
MLTKATLEKLQSFKISGFTTSLLTQLQSSHYTDLSFEERISLLVDNEYTRRLNVRTNQLFKSAKLPSPASLEAVDFSRNRGVAKLHFIELCQGNWLTQGTNVIITGPTGTGKTFLGSALAHSLVLKGLGVKYRRMEDWWLEMASLRERQRLSQSLAGLKRIPLLVIDEWMLDRLTTRTARLFLELIDSRYNQASCMFISQFPISEWHSRFEDPTLADAILDRIVHGAIKLQLAGESMRKVEAEKKLAANTQTGYVAGAPIE